MPGFDDARADSMSPELVPPRSAEPEARTLLPRDHKIRIASTELRRNLEELERLHAAFDNKWLTDDPPDFGGGRALLAELAEGLLRSKNSLRELIHLTRP
jgi:hypothetical protein